MKVDSWCGRPMVMCGVQDLRRHEEPHGPKYAIGVVGVMPFAFIPMSPDIGGFEIIRNFLPGDDAAAERYMFRAHHVDWDRASRNGRTTVRIARGMVETPGLRWLVMRPWGLMAWGWPEMEEYFPGILERMQLVITETCGAMEFVQERNIEFPTRAQEDASNELGIYWS